MDVWIASDHAGFGLKEKIKSHFGKWTWKDLGGFDESHSDYPVYADRLCQEMLGNLSDRGVLVCGSGIGMSIRANRYPHIRAAMAWNPEVTRLCRQHNDANVLCLGSRVTDEAVALSMIPIFLETEFEGGRHQPRIQQLSRPISGPEKE